MGFSGGGTNILKAHKHTSAVQDGGKLDMDNVTQAELTAGDVIFSDGNALQRLAIGAPNDEIRVSGANLPEWHTPAAASATWEVLADITLATPGTLTSGTFSAQNKFIKIFFYGAPVSATTLGIGCNGSSAIEYAFRWGRDFASTGVAHLERSMFYSSASTNEWLFFEMSGFNGGTAAADKLFNLSTVLNTTTGNTAPQSYQNYCKYYGGSYITSFEMVDANPGTTINYQTGSRLLVLAS